MSENNEIEPLESAEDITEEEIKHEAIDFVEKQNNAEIEEETPDWNDVFGKLTSSKKKSSMDEIPTDISEYLEMDMLALLAEKFRENRDNEIAPVRAVVNISDIGVCFKPEFAEIVEISVMRDIKRSLKSSFLEQFNLRILINKRRGENYLKPISITVEDMSHVPTTRPKKSKKKKSTK